jgi:hypothetical protein
VHPIDHLGDVFGRARRLVHGQDAEGRHVAIEPLDLCAGEGAEIHGALASNPKNVVVDVGDVAYAAHHPSVRAQSPSNHVEDVKGECVTEVTTVVRCDAADI